jgi:hypothetical protein
MAAIAWRTLQPTSACPDVYSTATLLAPLEEVGEQLLHDLGLVLMDVVARVVDERDLRFGQMLPEVSRRLWPVVCGFVPGR